MTIYMLAVLTRLLLFAPPPAAQPDPGVAPLERSAADEMSFYGVSELLVQAVALGDEDPEAAVPVLERALAALPGYAPELATEPDLLELRAHAQVSLARAHLLAGRKAKAVAAMDEAIRSALGRPIPVDIYGPSVEALWLERSQRAQAHPGRPVIVKCKVECRVYVNERRVPPDALRRLTMGVYRLWIDTEDHNDTILRRQLSVTMGAAAVTVKFTPSKAVERARMPPLAPLRDPPKTFDHLAAMKRAKNTMIVGGGLPGCRWYCCCCWWHFVCGCPKSCDLLLLSHLWRQWLRFRYRWRHGRRRGSPVAVHR